MPPLPSSAQVGSSDLSLSSLCLGTMMMGEQLSRAESVALLSAAWELGVTTFDSAEMSPIPQRAATHGDSERILGAFLKNVPRERAQVRHGAKCVLKQALGSK